MRVRELPLSLVSDELFLSFLTPVLRAHEKSYTELGFETDI